MKPIGYHAAHHRSSGQILFIPLPERIWNNIALLTDTPTLSKEYKKSQYHFNILFLILEEIETLFKKVFSGEATSEEHQLLGEVIHILHRPEYVTGRSLEKKSETRTVRLDLYLIEIVIF